MKKPIKCLIIVLSSVVVLCLIALLLWFTALDPNRGVVTEFSNALDLDTKLTPAQALNDLEFFYKHVTGRHPFWLEKDNPLKKKFTEMYTEEHERLEGLKDAVPDRKSSNEAACVTVLELWQAYSKMLAIIHDGHTTTWYQNNDQHFIHDFTQVMTYGVPTSIDGVSPEQFFETFKTLFSWETEEGARQTLWSNYFVSEHYLKLCGIDTSDGVDFTFNVNGVPEIYHYHFVSGSQIIYPASAVEDEQATEGEQNAEGEQAEQPINDYVYYSIDKANDLGLISILTCNYEDHYFEVVDNFFNEVLSQGITNIAVDLRGNGGGSSSVANEFIRHLDVDKYKSWNNSVRYGNFLYKNKDVVCTNDKYPQVFSGNVYILTNINTYSSAMDFAMLITDNGMGKIIGEASGNNPEGYGDCLYFQMPETGIALSVSFKKWYRVDQSKKDEFIEPDYPCDSWDAIETLYKIIKENK